MFLNSATDGRQFLSRSFTTVAGQQYVFRIYLWTVLGPGSLNLSSVPTAAIVGSAGQAWTAMDLLFTATGSTSLVSLSFLNTVSSASDFSVSNAEFYDCSKGFNQAELLGMGAGWSHLKDGASPEMVADPVNSATGSFDHVMLDLGVPGRGMPLVLTRNYDSRQTDSSVLGKGWWHSYVQSVSLVAGTGALKWRTGSGALIEFPAGPGGVFEVRPGIRVKASTLAGGGWQILADDQTKYSFDAGGKLVSIVDRSGQGVSLTYDASGRVSVVTDATGRTLTFTYGTGTTTTGGVAGTGRLIQVRGSNSRTVKYAYTGAAGASLLTSVTDVRAKVWSYTYTPAGFVEKETDPNGNVQFTNVYDASGRVLSQKDQLNNTSTFAYDDVAGTTTFTDASGAVTTYNRSGNVPNGMAGPAGSTATQFNAALDATSYTDATGFTWQATYDARGNMLSRAAPSPLSYAESWTYDSFNNPLSYTDRRGNTSTYTYDTAGRVLTEALPGGVTGSYVWNSDGTLASSTDPRGGVTSYTYDVNGNVLSQTTPMGFKTTFTYDAAGRVLTITEPRGNVAGATVTNFQQKFTYDSAGNVLTERDALNRTTTHVYDNGGRRTKTTAPDGGITLFEYNAANELIKATAPDGGITLFEYDQRGLRVKETSPIGAVTTFGYDPAGRLVSRVDPRGNEAGANPADFRWTFTYDAVGRPKTITDPLGRMTTTDYDVLGRVVTSTRPDGTTTVVYDPNGNVTSTTTDAGTGTSSFDALNRVVSSTDLRGKTSVFAYDLAGNVVQATDPLGRITKYTYDPDGRMTATVDARGNAGGANPADYTTTYLYDAAGHQTQVTDPLGLVTKQVYDRVGNVTTSTNPKNLSTTLLYDSMNRVTRVTAPIVGATNWTYTTMGYVASRTDALSTATVPRIGTWTYDLAGRKIEQRDAAGRRFTFGYDISSNPTTVVDANANAANNPALGSTTMTYDRLNRLTQKAYSDGTPSVSWTFDSEGRVATMVDGAGTTTYGYDAADRVNLITRGTDTWTYTYDASGNITGRTVPGGANSTATFDDAGQLAALADTTGSTSFTYDLVGNMIATGFANGVTQTRTFDRASRLASISTTGPAGPIGGFTYTRDPNGNPTAIDVAGPAGIIATESMRNTFDNANRLTKTCFTTTTCTTANQTVWTYNTVGSRLTEKIGSAAVSTYTYDTVDQLTAVTGPGAATFTYNANGDQLSAGVDTFTYNTARQTTSASVGGVTTQFAYDGNGNRHSVTTGGVVTQEVWDSVDGLGTLVAERTSTGTVKRRYTYAGSMPVKFEDPVASTVGYYQTDAIGTVSNLTTSAGTVGATYRYNPYGTNRTATSVLPAYSANPLRYTGQQLDLTGNYNLRARHYNANRGGFTQTDPMPYGAGSNFETTYAYGRNNPALYTDPTGLRSCNTSLVRQGVTTWMSLNFPWSEMSYCDAVRVDKALGPMQIAGATAAGLSCGIAASPMAMAGPAGAGYAAGIGSGCAAAANTFMTNQRSGTAGGYYDSVTHAAAEGYLTTPPIYGPPVPVATKPGISSVDDVMSNPNALAGKTPTEVEAIIGNAPGWKVETLGKGSQKGNGWVLREYTPQGNPTGRQIRWHPGGGHHGPDPYWKVNTGQGQTGEIR